MAKAKSPNEDNAHKSGTRSLVETLLILIVLVLFLRGCLLESFRIPSSSMEPALMGHPYHGDRVIAWKPSLRFSAPERWSIDVFVKHPDDFERLQGETSSRNFIKRVIGLPGERLIIAGGDVFVERPDEPSASIARKPEQVQSSVWHLVYAGRAGRAQDWMTSGSLRVSPDDPMELVSEATGAGAASLARNHYADDDGLITNLYIRSARTRVCCPVCATTSKVVISTHQTRVECPAQDCTATIDLLSGDIYSDAVQRFCCPKCSRMLEGTEEYLDGRDCPHCGAQIQTHVQRAFDVPGRYPFSRSDERAVSDMRISFDVVAATHTGSVGADISVDDRTYTGEVRFGERVASILVGGTVVAKAEVALPQSSQTWRLSFAHVDHATELRIDDALVLRHEYDLDWRKCAGGPTSNKVTLTTHDAEVRVRAVRIERDLHYLAKGKAGIVDFYHAGAVRGSFSPAPTRRRMGEPPDTGEADAVRSRQFTDTEFFMMGDNSPSSYDSRMWGPIEEDDLVGQAVFLFWPPNRSHLVN
jgi:signal peptidase I